VAGGGQLAVGGAHADVEHGAVNPAAADRQRLVAAVIGGSRAGVHAEFLACSVQNAAFSRGANLTAVKNAAAH
jgi:hypothetical protein